MRTILLDTNVLLSDPDVLLGYPDAETIIPETVLSELDKIKTSRADPDLRFRGRQVSRALFELSESGVLTEGIDLPDGGRLRVVPLETDFELPEGMSTRNADDRILAVGLQECDRGCEDLTVVTNDLNMLLKAQTLGLQVERREGGVEGSFGRRFILRPFQRYKVPLAILGLAVAVFAAIVFVALYTQGQTGGTPSLPDEFDALLSPQQERMLNNLLILEEDPTDFDARRQLADDYFELYEATNDLQYAESARRHYELFLENQSDDSDARTDLASTYFILGQTDRAIQQVITVLQADPDHLNANYNLGIFYWQGRGDYVAASAQFDKVVELTDGATDPGVVSVGERAQANLDLIRQEAEEEGAPLPEDGDEGAAS